MRRAVPVAILLMTLSVFSFPTFLNGIVPPANAVSAGFSFSASGDIGSLTVSTSVNNLNRLQTVNPNFFLGLGGFSYDPSVTGGVWCGQFKSKFNNIQILPGDRDTGGHSSTFGETHSYERYVNGCSLDVGVPIVCGPVEGDCYGKEYYFDYPAVNPIARFIFAAPKIYNITGVCTLSPNCSSQTGQPCTDQYGCWQYNANDLHYNWIANAIDNARSKGIGWVIVATHKLCISSSDATCSMGIAFFNMLVQKKVDLIIQAHDNAYERSKQLALNPTTCPKMTTDGSGYAVYNSGCVVDAGTGNYTRGAGSVVVVQGAWIDDLYGVGNGASNTQNVAEAPYFAKLMGHNTAGNGLGFTKYTISAGSIDVQTYFSGTFSDKFSLTTGLTPVPSATWSPLVPQIGQIVTFTGTATGGVGPYSFTWDFGDGSGATGSTVSHSYSSANYFNVTLTATDSANRVGSNHSIIALGSWNSAVPCSPTQSTIEQVIGKVSIQRNATIPTSVGADYSGGGFKLAGNQPFGSSPNNWPFSKKSLQPPCFVNGISTFVELHNVALTVPPEVATYDCRTSYDQSNGAAMFPNGRNCDVVFSVGNVSATSCPSCYMHRIYAEIDGDWNASGTAPPIPPNPGQLIDVQGFVYWDADSLNFSTHNWSGWELHPFTAWRPVQSSVLPPTVAVNAPTPNPANTGTTVTVSFTVSSSATITGVTVNWGDGTTSDSLSGTARSDTHIYGSTGSAKAQTFTVTVTASNSAGPGSGTTSETVNDRPPVTTVSSVSPNPALVSQTVTMTFSATDPDGAISSFSVNWGDGTTPDSLPGTATSDTHAYHSGGNFTITVTATDNSGSTGSGTISETVSAPLAPTVNISSVTPNPANTGAIVTATFTVSSTLPVTSIAVNWGDGTTPDSLAATATSDTHVYASTGNSKSQIFTITISATNSAGTGSASTQETVNDRRPTVTITGVAPNPANTGSTISTTFTSGDVDGTVSGITVNWGDGTAIDNLLGTATSDTHTYASTGISASKSFTITVTATDNGGSTGSAVISETVNDRPPVVALTSVSPNPANTGQLVTVTFTATDIDGTISSITVNWGDGSTPDILTGTARTDTHTYGSANTFTITVTAVDNSGSTGQGTGSAMVQTPVSPPTVNVNNPTPNPTATGQTVTITFTVSSTVPVTGITVNWGDGTAVDSLPGNSTSDIHIFSSTGSVKSQTFTITVTATNSGGSGSGTGTETVNDRSPTVTISTVSPNPANTGVTVTAAFSSNDADGSIVSVSVNWGDGSTASVLAGSATSASHVYSSTGSFKSQNFTITITVTDNSGNTGQRTSSVIVNDRSPVVVISNISPNPANTGQPVTLIITATDPDGTISSININWGDGTTPDSLPGSATSDTHSYSQTGTFTISITGTDNSGSTGQATGTMTVTVPGVSQYALVVTAEGKIYKLYQNGTLTLVGQPVTTPLRQVAWKPDGTYALIAGDFAVLLKYDGTQLTTVPTGISTGYNFWSVSWKQDGSYALIGGSVGLLLKYDGISVKQISNAGGTTILSMSWHPSGSYVVMACKSGVLRTYDGTIISSFSTGTTNDLNTVAWNPNGQYALIGGLNGVVLTFNGTLVAPLNTNGLTGTNAIKSIAFNPTGSLALLVGDNGMVLTYNGSTLTLLPNMTGSWLYAVSWSSSGTAYILGGSGTMLTYSSGTLSKLSSTPLTTSQFRGIAWKP